MAHDMMPITAAGSYMHIFNSGVLSQSNRDPLCVYHCPRRSWALLEKIRTEKVNVFNFLGYQMSYKKN
jgi:hypothetical protein